MEVEVEEEAEEESLLAGLTGWLAGRTPPPSGTGSGTEVTGQRFRARGSALSCLSGAFVREELRVIPKSWRFVQYVCQKHLLSRNSLGEVPGHPNQHEKKNPPPLTFRDSIVTVQAWLG